MTHPAPRARPRRYHGLMNAFRVIPALAFLAAAVPAQFEQPEQKIQEIAEEVAEQMQEIDKLLLQAPKTGGAGAAEQMAEAVKKMDELLDQTTESQGQVVKKIDELIATGTDVNFMKWGAWTALSYAAKNGRLRFFPPCCASRP